MKKRVVKKRRPALSHHSKTGKVLPRQHTSYPVIVFILMIMGLFMAGLTFKAHAADVAINATVYGTPPTTPATIVTPVDGTHFTAVPITVDGTCGPGDVIKLYRNTVFGGSVICAGDGTFQIQTSLDAGSNDLQARTFNFADQEGPTSPVVNVVYDPPPTPPSGGGSSSGGGSNTDNSSNAEASAPPPPFHLTTPDTTVNAYYVGDKTEIGLSADSGTAPFAFSISWGDGETSVIERTELGPFTVSHLYKRGGPGEGDSYAIKVTATDAAGMTTFLELSVIVHDKDSVALALKTPDIGTTSTLPALHIPLQLKFMWPAYSIAMLMGVSFWLGQHQTLLHLRPKIRPRLPHFK